MSRTFQPVACIVAAFFVGAVRADQPVVTIYNQNFGVVREQIPLDLQAGENRLTYTEIAAHVEPDSVILRDAAGRRALRVLEQNYRNDPLSQELLLSLYEGQTIDFLVGDKVVSGRIVRSGYVPHREAWQQYGQAYYLRQIAYSGGGSSAPIIEIEGKLRFGVPGLPLFPNLATDTILKPTLEWVLGTDAAGRIECELSYVTGGMNWKADYNVLAPEQGDELELIGWVTIDNQCGRTFENAWIKLMAGDVSKIQEAETMGFARSSLAGGRGGAGDMMPPVSEKTFDEYHLYSINRATTLRDRESKQVEFIRAGGVQSRRVYVYDGLQIDWSRFRGWDAYSLRIQRDFGAPANKKVWVIREFENAEANQLGLPLPAGRMRFYRGDADGRYEFTGENRIDHTPKDEAVRIYTGNAFDLVGEHTRTDFQISNNQDWLDETFEIKVRNHKDEPVSVRIAERLYRWRNWEIVEKSHDFVKKDSQAIEFPVEVPANGEMVLTYKVHYTW